MGRAQRAFQSLCSLYRAGIATANGPSSTLTRRGMRHAAATCCLGPSVRPSAATQAERSRVLCAERTQLRCILLSSFSGAWALVLRLKLGLHLETQHLL